MNPGIFITFEGPEGAGKTTVINKIAEKLKAEGYPVVVTREPGGIRIAEQIRAVILDKENVEMDPKTEVLLYAAARRQHIVERLIPALSEGCIVLCDRYVDSSLAYQGFARKQDVEAILEINQFAIEELMPDLTLYFDLPVEIGLNRINQSNEREINRLDLEKIEFHQSVRKGFQELLERFPNRIEKVDASQSIEHVFDAAYKKISHAIYSSNIKIN